MARTRPGSGSGARHFRTSGGRPYRRWPRRILVLANVVTFVVIAASAAGAGYAVSIIDSIRHTAVGHLFDPGTTTDKSGHRYPAAFTMLIVGSDTRSLKTAIGGIGNSQTNAEQLSDSIVLARVVPATHQIALLSIPRDLQVQIPGVGYSKINAAYAGGDATRLVQTIESDLDIRINHFAAVNFDTLEQVADAIGGVPQYFPTPAFDMESGLFISQAGCVDLQGSEALGFARSRNYFFVPGLKTITAAEEQYLVSSGQAVLQLSPESDLGRIQRQQAFIRNALHRAQRQGDLSNPQVLLKIVTSLASNITLDSHFSFSDLVSLASDFRHIHAASIPSWTYPTVNSGDGLAQVPAADAAQVAEFEAFGQPAAPAPSTSTTTRGAATTTTSTTVPPSSVDVAVENGTGAYDQAGTAATDLRSAGYTVTSVTDASSLGNPTNVIHYGTGGHAAAAGLQAALAGGATLQADPTLSGDSLVLVTGATFAGLAGGASAGSTTTTTAPATTTTTAPAAGNAYSSATEIVPTSSSYYDQTYIPPGRTKGQVVSTCGN